MRFLLSLLALPLASSASDVPKSTDNRLVVELFVASPQIKHPTGVAIDGQGRVYVIESHTHFPPDGYAGGKSDRVYVFAKPGTDGRATERTVFADGFNMGMDLLWSADGWLYVAERGRISRLRDTNGDSQADVTERLIDLQTTGTYPHNGLSGLASDRLGHLYFGLGENLGHPYTMIDRDGNRIVGAEGIGGGVFRCTRNGKQLKQIARGFWNPFGVCVDEFGRIFAVENDPGASPPCRLLHIVPGGDYGYQYQYGRSGIHPFIAWDGELANTLPMVCGVGEAPCEVIHFNSHSFPDEYRGEYLVTSWGDHRVERYRLERRGASVSGSMQPLVQGGRSFRPVSMATAPDGTLYVSDWGSRLYELHGEGKIWRIRPKELRPRKAKPLPKPATADADLRWLAQLRDSKNLDDLLAAADDRDPFVSNAAITGLAKLGDKLASVELTKRNPAERRAVLLALKENRAHDRLADFLDDKDPDIRFEVLRWIADYKLGAHREFVQASLRRGDGNYRLFRAYVACIDSLDGRKNPDRTNTPLARELMKAPGTPERLHAHLIRYLAGQQHAYSTAQLIDWSRSTNVALQREAVWSLRFQDNEAAQSRLAKLATDAAQPVDLRLAATAALGQAETLLTLAGGENKALRDEALRSLVGVPLRAGASRALGQASKRLPDAAPLVKRALGQSFAEARRPADDDTQAWLKLIDHLPGKADAGAGQRIFHNKKIALCSNCHQVSERGTRVGPDLTHIGRSIDRDRLLENILEPSRELAPHYRTWVITMNDGQVHAGIALRRGGNAEVYLGADGKEIALNKLEIKSRKETHQSLMPPGLAHTLTLPELRDLLAFLLTRK